MIGANLSSPKVPYNMKLLGGFTLDDAILVLLISVLVLIITLSLIVEIECDFKDLEYFKSVESIIILTLWLELQLGETAGVLMVLLQED